MTDSHPIIHAFQLDGGGSATPIPVEGAAEAAQDKSRLTWLHINVLNPGALNLLENQLGLDWIIAEALMADETRPRMMELNEGVLIILRGVNLNQGAEPEDMVSLRAWITEYGVISAGRRQLKATADIIEKLEQNMGPCGAGEWLTEMCVELYDHMQSAVTTLNETTDDLEDRVLVSQDESIRESIISTRKRAIVFRRYISPQRDVIARLQTSELYWISANDKRRLTEVMDWLTRYVEDLDAIRERSQVIKDELAAAMNDRLNRHLYLLSIVAAVSLPLGLLTGLFGINIGGMPGVDDGNAFWLFSALLGLLLVLEIVYLRKKGWI
ncbi:zinc transporter ZntB [Hahella sp. KA22]|uniref:zinc transporter ZntB n=1 Tax=Hahella sp. KA22 TaxID=1628392 RepID=UPI000FDE9F47|nr:zinc transporter ZntB [Hahella sp. KA22]AZZ94983.1 zinc transporter ZntB [Hahella sp. KA22]QAY52628.1 zinc transporter ZntB [Hahella sp. KA22]